MIVLKWIGMFFVFWFAGSIIAMFIDLILLFLGGGLGKYGSGLVILIVIVYGLFKYGKKQKKRMLNGR
ncbi:hypothetical protein [Cytobacillus praedii]|uniref:Uncharacterized protein n=1 Tax=Cytobacillus praedii TaxID=1742358 RepID=A0A4R1AMI9_9BACI|nr:hypothetical protein [Cytobacillus praedii]TCJ00956.1 hypothetical protein E0Y62_26360 [Cytobacillus praedii]